VFLERVAKNATAGCSRQGKGWVGAAAEEVGERYAGGCWEGERKRHGERVVIALTLVGDPQKMLFTRLGFPSLRETNAFSYG